MVVVKYYRETPCTGRFYHVAQTKIQNILRENQMDLKMEQCFYVDIDEDDGLEFEDESKLMWILEAPFQKKKLSRKPYLKAEDSTKCLLVEIGPRLNFSTPFSTNAVSMCQSAGLKMVTRVEYSTCYLLQFESAFNLNADSEIAIVNALHDRMTECRYSSPVDGFNLEHKTEDIYEVDVLKEGREALEKANIEMGLAFDNWDLDYYTKLFKETIQRNPTNVECFDLAQSNSEHSRHWFFRGRLVVDDEEVPTSLFKMIMSTQENSNNNNVIQFSDNSSAIKGFDVKVIQPVNTTEVSKMEEIDAGRHIIFTAETHNFPTGVAPFPGATTGTGGRIRDVQATGRGAHVVAGTAGYSFGSLRIPGYPLPWEDPSSIYPSNFASPLDIAIEASNGASDYGNKFGEPVLAGFARSFGLTLEDGERREYIKPIMFSGGIGQLEGCHVSKAAPQKGMEVVKLGGPIYRIGVGGGAASSVQVQGDNKEELDFGAVQRGDSEMEQKLNRLIRACIEMRQKNPIASIHDQGAGGNGNVLKEIVEPAGAIIKASQFQLGDPTISLLELWGAEYQESNAVLVRPEDKEVLRKIGERERCPVCFVGKITGDGKIKVENFHQLEGDGSPAKKRTKKNFPYPVDLELEHVLGSMPRKEFILERRKPDLKPLTLEVNLTLKDALDRVLRLPSVASKRYLTNKVDRCVTGLVAQQQCVGPLHTPLADVAVTALSYFDKVGSVTAIGEQPIKGLIDPACMARMSVREALTNLVGSVTAIGEQPIKGLIDPACMSRISVGEALTNLVGSVTAIGEQPIKGLIDPACMARMSVREALTNLVGSVTAIGEQPIKGLIDPACMSRISVGEALTNLVGSVTAIGEQPIKGLIDPACMSRMSVGEALTTLVGSATAIGEQPIKGLIDPACMARMSVGEALTNLVFACITDLKVRPTLNNSDYIYF
ncbi:PFAS [Mytilus coruscus]|uniref:PFAS n=1 Tax=Mytilus coruscus TaxID=42192 RepID=A0A6J8BDF6_MYTCO|nr:PFAS [Mytilus coruscus]